jgi:serine/threonine protein kinase
VDPPLEIYILQYQLLWLQGVLHDGMEVAIKQLSSKFRQDNQEFVKEVQLIASVQHPNIVRLLGCSLTSSTRYLVYEYVDNKSLAQALFGTYTSHYL